MKALRFLPLVYVVGVHGFVFFAPYVVLVMTVDYAVKQFKARRVRVAPVPVGAR